MKLFKYAYVKFQAELVADVCMLRNSKVTVGGLHLSSASRSEVVEQLETMIVSSSDIQFYPECRLRLGNTSAKQESPDGYSYGGANSHKFCMDQGERRVIKFRSGLNLFDLIKL